MKAFEQANDEGMIRWHYAFADFISNTLTLSCSFFSLLFFISLLASFVQLGDLAATTKDRIHNLTAAQAKAAANELRAREASQELEVAQVIVGEKEKEVQQAI